MKIGEYLISKGKLTETQIKDALFVQTMSEKRLGEILIESGCITDSDVSAYLAYDSGREFFKELNTLSLYIDKQENEELGFSFLYEIPAIVVR